MSKPSLCPCGSDKPFTACCGPRLSGITAAETAEKLMRSRYTAYSLADEDYLLQTWHPSTRPERLHLATATATKWIGLKIIGTEAGGLDDDSGTVEFVARYKINGRAHRMQEKSRFVRERGKWFYLDGTVDDPA